MIESNNEDEVQPPFPEELTAAIQRARSRTATPLMIESLMARVLELDESLMKSQPKRDDAPRFARLVATTAVAVSIAAVLIGLGYLVTLISGNTNHNRVADNRVGGNERSVSEVTKNGVPKSQLANAIRYSQVRQSPVLVSYRTIAVDLDRAEAKTEEISAAIKMAILRNEIQSTLDEYYDWSIKE